MVDNPLVSVIIPTKNSDATLRKCLDSIRNQTYPNIEIIVVDSFSRDKTKRIAEEYGAGIIEIEAKRSKARNIGAEKARGEVIFFIDSDMELDSTVIEECVKKVREEYHAVIIPEVSVGQGFWARCKALEKLCYIGDETIEAARVFERKTFESVNGYDEELEAGEDWDLNHRVKKAGFRVGRVYALIKHREGRLSLWETARKKYQYGKTVEKYRRKHPKEAKQQLKLIRPAFIRNWKKLVKDPINAIGLMVLKTCEFGAGGIGYLKSKFLNQNKSLEQFLGRLKVIQGLVSKGKFSLSVGSKETRFAEINIDIDPFVNPDIVADVRSLPFRDHVFHQVLFTDVIEHLPKRDEPKALQEIHRILCNEGELILTTPYNSALYTFLDPARYVMTHRHYKKECLKDLLESHGFQNETMFTAGGLWACLSNLWYCFITYPLKTIFHHPLPHALSFMQRLEDEEYSITRQNGYTIFVKAKKRSVR